MSHSSGSVCGGRWVSSIPWMRMDMYLQLLYDCSSGLHSSMSIVCRLRYINSQVSCPIVLCGLFSCVGGASMFFVGSQPLCCVSCVAVFCCFCFFGVCSSINCGGMGSVWMCWLSSVYMVMPYVCMIVVDDVQML